MGVSQLVSSLIQGFKVHLRFCWVPQFFFPLTTSGRAINAPGTAGGECWRRGQLWKPHGETHSEHDSPWSPPHDDVLPSPSTVTSRSLALSWRESIGNSVWTSSGTHCHDLGGGPPRHRFVGPVSSSCLADGSSWFIHPIHIYEHPISIVVIQLHLLSPLVKSSSPSYKLT